MGMSQSAKALITYKPSYYLKGPGSVCFYIKGNVSNLAPIIRRRLGSLESPAVLGVIMLRIMVAIFLLVPAAVCAGPNQRGQGRYIYEYRAWPL